MDQKRLEMLPPDRAIRELNAYLEGFVTAIVDRLERLEERVKQLDGIDEHELLEEGEDTES